jgi:hypothetical protein
MSETSSIAGQLVISEEPGLTIAYNPVGDPAQNDVETAGRYTGKDSIPVSYRVEIVVGMETSPNTFKWQKNEGTWSSPIEVPPNVAYELQDGVYVYFGSGDGYTSGDAWTITVANVEAEAGLTVRAPFVGTPLQPNYAGATLDDLSTSGTYEGYPGEGWLNKGSVQFTIEIDSVGSGENPDTFRWSLDGSTTWHDELRPITAGIAQNLGETGVKVTFAHSSGHTNGDDWYVAVMPASSAKFFDYHGDLVADIGFAGIQVNKAIGLLSPNYEMGNGIIFYIDGANGRNPHASLFSMDLNNKGVTSIIEWSKTGVEIMRLASLESGVEIMCPENLDEGKSVFNIDLGAIPSYSSENEAQAASALNIGDVYRIGGALYIKTLQS